MTPEEFHAMQKRLEEIRLRGITFYARATEYRSDLGEKGSTIAAQFKQALDTKRDAERRLENLEEQWGKLYGGDRAISWAPPEPIRTGSVNVDPNGKTIRTAEIDAHPY